MNEGLSGEDRVLINPPAAALGQRNAIMSWRSAKHLHDVVGPLSIKWMPIGWSVWRTARATFRVDGGRFLVLNHGRAYALSRAGSEPQESFCPFFAASFVEGVRRDVINPDVVLLDRGEESAPAPFEFREQLYDADVHVLPQLQRMWAALRHGRATQDWLEDEFHVLAERLLRSDADVQRQIDRLPARRASTRAEVHRRLQRGREYMHAHFAEPLRLADIARAACLSAHHFHRLFRAAFGRAPHAYLTELRLERAAALLARTEAPVTAACFAVGFESVGSFSTLFHRRMGVSPTAFRRDRRKTDSPQRGTEGHRGDAEVLCDPLCSLW